MPIGSLRGLDAKARRKFERDPKVRAAALYDAVKTMFPPRTAKEKQSLSQGRKAVGCR